MSNNDFFEKRRNLKYDKGHKGPFEIFIERIKLNDNDVMTGISNAAFARNMRNFDSLCNFVKIGYDLRSTGRNKFKISFADFLSANDFVRVFNEVDFFEGQKWEAYIPAFKIFKDYVLSGIEDPTVTADEVKLWLGPYRGQGVFPEIISCERMQRKIFTEENGTKKDLLVPSNKFKCRFLTTEVPDRGTMWALTVFINPFEEKPKRCTWCLRYGHVERFCKDRFRREKVCVKCSGSGHDEVSCVEEKICCINCARAHVSDFNHKANDSRCPIFLYEKDIKRIMAQRNLSHKDAEKILQENGGIPPKKIIQRTFAETIKIDMNALVNKAKDFREIMQAQKQQRFKERQERRDRDRTGKNEVQNRLNKNTQNVENFVEINTESEKRKLIDYSDLDRIVTSDDDIEGEAGGVSKKHRGNHLEFEGVVNTQGMSMEIDGCGENDSLPLSVSSDELA